MCDFAKDAAMKVAWLIVAVALAPLVMIRMLADYVSTGENGMEEMRWP